MRCNRHLTSNSSSSKLSRLLARYVLPNAQRWVRDNQQDAIYTPTVQTVGFPARTHHCLTVSHSVPHRISAQTRPLRLQFCAKSWHLPFFALFPPFALPPLSFFLSFFLSLVSFLYSLGFLIAGTFFFVFSLSLSLSLTLFLYFFPILLSLRALLWAGHWPLPRFHLRAVPRGDDASASDDVEPVLSPGGRLRAGDHG